jgi:hypothetical protein
MYRQACGSLQVVESENGINFHNATFQENLMSGYVTADEFRSCIIPHRGDPCIFTVISKKVDISYSC